MKHLNYKFPNLNLQKILKFFDEPSLKLQHSKIDKTQH